MTQDHAVALSFASFFVMLLWIFGKTLKDNGSAAKMFLMVFTAFVAASYIFQGIRP